MEELFNNTTFKEYIFFGTKQLLSLLGSMIVFFTLHLGG